MKKLRIIILLLFIGQSVVYGRWASVSSSQVINYGCIPNALHVSTARYCYYENSDWYYSTVSASGPWVSMTMSTDYYQPPSATQTRWYKVDVYTYGCGLLTTNAIQILVLNKVSDGGIVGTNQQICPGFPERVGSIQLPSIVGDYGSISYQWQSSANGTGGWANIDSATLIYYDPPLASENIYYRRRVSNSCDGDFKYSNVVNIEVGNFWDGGTIGGTQSVCYNSVPSKLTNVSSAVGGTGTTVYQWQFSLTGTGGWTDISGETQLEHSPTVGITANVYYRRKASNSCGIVYSNTIIKTVYNEIQAGTIGTSKTICYNTSSGTFTNDISPSGGSGTFTYAWESSDTGVGGWSVLGGVTQATMIPFVLTATRYYRRKATNSCGFAYSNVVTITVSNELTPGSIGSDQTICNGTIPNAFSSFGLANGGIGTINYAWQESSNGTSGWVNISGATSSTYSSPALASNKYFRRSASNTCGTVYSNVISVTVNPAIVAGEIGSSSAVCFGLPANTITNFNFPTGGQGAFSYSWEVSNDGISGWSVVSGAISTEYSPGVLPATRYYRRKEVNSCSTVFTNVVMSGVNPKINPGSIAGTQSLCYGSIPTMFTSETAASGGKGSWTYYWQESPNGTSGWVSISGAINLTYTPPVLTSTKFFRRVAVNGCGTVNSNSISVSVSGEQLGGSIGSTQGIEPNICFNAAPAQFTNTSSATGGSGSYSYKWEQSLDGLTNWNEIIGAYETTYTHTALTQTTHFRRKSTNTCGSVYSNSIKVIVAAPVVVGSIGYNQQICNGVTPLPLENVTAPQGGIPPFTHKWQVSTSGSGGWFDITGETSEFINLSIHTATRLYRRVDINTCGSGNSNVVTITVGAVMSGGQVGGNQDVCYDGVPLNFNNIVSASGGVGAINYQWQGSVNGIDNWFDITGATAIEYNPANMTESRHFRRKATNTCDVVFSNSIKVTVKEEFLGGSILTNQNICNGTPPSLITSLVLATGGIGTISYAWELSLNGINGWSEIIGVVTPTYTAPTLTQTSYFRRIATNSCGVRYSNVSTVTVGSLVVPGVIGYEQSICNGDTPEQLVTVNAPIGGLSGFNFQWESSISGTGGWSDIAGQTSANYSSGPLTSSLFFRRKDINSCATVTTNTIKVIVGAVFAGGTISGNQSICINTQPSPIMNVTFASGGLSGTSYQWMQSYVSNGSWQNILGQNSPSLTLPVLAQTTYYRRMAENPCGTTYSNTITITVAGELDPGTIGNNQTVCYGAVPETLLSLNAPSGGSGAHTFKWERSTETDIWVEILGSNSESFTPSAVTVQTRFRRKVINLCGERTSNEITISVIPQIVPGTIAGNQEICNGLLPLQLQSLTLPSGGFSGFTYGWQSSSSGTGNWSDIAGQTSYLYAPTVLTQTTYFRRKEINSCGTVYTNSVTIIAGGVQASGIIEGTEKICFGNSASTINNLSLPIGGLGEYSYSWENSLSGTGNWTAIDGATNPFYNPIGLNQNMHFRRKEVNTCGTLYSNSVSKQFLTELLPGSIGSNQGISFGQVPNMLVSINAVSGGNGVYSFVWQQSLDNIQWNNIHEATAITYQPTALNQTTHFRRKVIDNICGEKISNFVTVLVGSDLFAGEIVHNQIICNGAAPSDIVQLSPASGGGGSISLSWENSINGTNWSTIVGQTGQNLIATPLTQTTYFRRKAVSGTLERYSNLVTITVLAPIQAPTLSGSGTYCKGSNVNMQVLSPIGGLSYKWFNANNDLIHTGLSLSENNLVQSKLFNIRAEAANNCLSAITAVTLTVDPIKADFIQSHTNVVEGQNVNYTSTSVNATQWEWNFGFGELMYEPNPWLYYNQVGLYTTRLKVTSNLNCIDLKTVVNAVTVLPYTSIDENSFGSVSVTPNPTTGVIYVKSTFIVSSVEIYSSVGALVDRIVFAGEKEVSLDIARKGIKPGLYLVVVKGEGMAERFKIIKK